MDKLDRIQKLTYAYVLAQFLNNDEAFFFCQDLLDQFYEGWNKSGISCYELTEEEDQIYRDWLAHTHSLLFKEDMDGYEQFLRRHAGSEILKEVGLL
jgi:hypothetical protein